MKFIRTTILSALCILCLTVTLSAQHVSAVTPSSAGRGATVTIVGDKFQPSSTVFFTARAGVIAAITNVSNPKSISAVVPSSAVTGRVYVQSGNNKSNTVNFAVMNRAPVVQPIPLQTITLPAGLSLNGIATDDGLPNGTMTAAWSQIGGPVPVMFANANALNTTASFPGIGRYTLRLTVSDGALSSTADFNVVVQSGNLPPVVSAGVNQSITMSGQTALVTLTGSMTDDGQPSGQLTATWIEVSGPGPAAFVTDARLLQVNLSFSLPGPYVFRLTASDGALTTTSDVTVTVTNPVNQAPAVNAGADQTITLPAVAILSGAATDDGLPAGSSLSVKWSQVSGPGLATFSNALAVTMGIPSVAKPALTSATTVSFSVPGVYTLRLSATDGNLTSADDVAVTVNPAVPTLTNSIAPSFLLQNGSLALLTLTLSQAQTSDVVVQYGTAPAIVADFNPQVWNNLEAVTIPAGQFSATLKFSTPTQMIFLRLPQSTLKWCGCGTIGPSQSSEWITTAQTGQMMLAGRLTR